MSRKERLVLDIAKTDSTFERAPVAGEAAWVGKCLHCGARLVVFADGRTAATIEHILPRNQGGDDALENVALACARCNAEKGVRHDWRKRGAGRAAEVIEALLARRRARWRAPEDA